MICDKGSVWSSRFRRPMRFLVGAGRQSVAVSMLRQYFPDAKKRQFLMGDSSVANV